MGDTWSEKYFSLDALILVWPQISHRQRIDAGGETVEAGGCGGHCQKKLVLG